MYISRFFLGLIIFCSTFSIFAQTIRITDERKTLSGVPLTSHGSGFVIKNGLVVTASHMIPDDYPSLREGMLRANGVPIRLLCYDNIADIAILKPESKISNTIPLELEDNVKKGTVYTGSYSNDKGITMALSHSLGDSYEVPLHLKSKGNILDIVPIKIRTVENNIKETLMKMLITPNDGTKGGFSGGPVISVSSGKVIGIVMGGENGSFGFLSHVDNLKLLLSRPECQK